MRIQIANGDCPENWLWLDLPIKDDPTMAKTIGKMASLTEPCKIYEGEPRPNAGGLPTDGRSESMNFFEQELRKLFEGSEAITDPRFTGRVCTARLTDSTNVKLEFVTHDTHEKYEGIKATVFNRNEGEIDSTVFRFADILGKKAIPGNPYLKNGVYPYIWSGGRDGYEWYAYKPTPRDFEMIADTVDSYLEMYQEPVQTQGMTQSM